MDRKTALRQLNLMAIKCGVCQVQYPTYRIAIRNKRGQGKSEKALEVPKHMSPRFSSPVSKERLSRSPKYIPIRHLHRSPSAKEAVHQNQNMRNIETLQKCKSHDPPKQNLKERMNSDHNSHNKSYEHEYICLNCLKSQKLVKKEQMTKIHEQTYHEMGLRYISHLPTPDYEYALKCKQLAGNLQHQMKQLQKNILSQIEQFKFTVFKVCKECEKYCEGYIEYVKFFEKIRIEEWYAHEIGKGMEKKKDKGKEKEKEKGFFLNQNQQLLEINKKIASLNQLKRQIDTVEFNLPKISQIFNETLDVASRKKVTICDVPISSMTHAKGRNFYGSADGRIIYECIEGLVHHHAHDSLIRSFAFDGQFTLYSGSDDHYIGAWDLHEEKIRLIKKFGMLEQKSYHRNIAILNEGKTLVSTRGQFDNFVIRLWDVSDDYQNNGQLEGHVSFIRSMAVADSKKDIIITVSDDKSVKLWDTKTKKLLKSHTLLNKLQNILVSQKQKLVAVTDDENKVTILDMFSLEPLTGWVMPRKIVCCGTHDQGSNIIIGIITNIGIWDWSGNKIWSFETEATSFVPTFLIEVGGKILVSDGTGVINQFNIGKLSLLE